MSRENEKIVIKGRCSSVSMKSTFIKKQKKKVVNSIFK